MMFHQSMGRSQRAKGSKAKNIFQVIVLLAVVVWLVYQTKHSYDRKNKYAETDYNKPSLGDTDINFGRKVKAGSENRISIDSHGKNSHETAETGETGVSQEAFDHNTEDTGEVKNESEESQEEITNSGKEETQQEQQGHVDDNGDSHAVGDVNSEGTQGSLHLPSQKDNNNFEQHKDRNADGNFVEKYGLPRDGATTADGTNSSDGETIASDETSSATSQIETGESAEQRSETSETGDEHSDNARTVTEETSGSSASNDQGHKNISDDNDTHKGETVEAQQGFGFDTETASNNTVKEATTYPRSEAELVSESVNLPNSTEEKNLVVPVNDKAPKREVEPQAVNISQAEIAGNSSMAASTTGTSSEVENTKFPKSVEESNVVMPDSNGVPGREEGESQADRISEEQAAGNSSIDAVIADTSSEGESANLPNTSEEKGLVMSDVNGAPKWEEVQSQTDHVSEDEKADNNSLEEANSDRRSTSEVPENEAGAQGTNASDAGVNTDITVEENDLKSSDEGADSSLTNKNEHVELPANREGTVVQEVQSQGSGASDAENPGKSTLGEEKSKKPDDLSADSAMNNEQNNSKFQTSKTPSKEVASHEDSALKVEGASKNVEDSTAEQQSKDATASDLGNNIELNNRTAEGQESSTGSESSNSGLKED